MQKKKVLIISNKFNNGHVAGLMGWYKTIEKIGFLVELALPHEYREYFTDGYVIIKNKKIDFNNYSHMIIFNLSVLDIFMIKQAKKIKPSIKIMFVYHEPWRGLQNEMGRLVASIKVCFLMIVKKIISDFVLSNSDCVILPSKFSYDVYKMNQSKKNDCFYCSNLIFTDQANNKINYNKKYFSFISTASYDKSIDLFFEFVKYCDVLEENINFLVVTKTDVSNYIDQHIKRIIEKGRLIIKSGKPLSEDEMNNAYDNSLCTWLLYRSSSQSGVLPKCFMWGSPVIASNVGIFSEQINGDNGLIINDIGDFDEIINSFHFIENNKEKYIKNSRMSFDMFYSIDSNVQIVERIMNEI